MTTFQWSHRNAVYVPEFDREHREIFRAAGELHRGLAAGARPEQLETELAELIAQTLGHLRHEEKKMRSAGYPQYAWHKRQHDAARAKAGELVRSVRRGDREGVLAGLENLENWMQNHTAVCDRMMTAYLRVQGYLRLRSRRSGRGYTSSPVAATTAPTTPATSPTAGNRPRRAMK